MARAQKYPEVGDTLIQGIPGDYRKSRITGIHDEGSWVSSNGGSMYTVESLRWNPRKEAWEARLPLPEEPSDYLRLT